MKAGFCSIIAAFALTISTAPAFSQAAPSTPSALPHTFQPKLDYAFTIELVLNPALFVGASPTGAERAAVYVKSGTITGPLLKGIVLPMSGGDWARKRPDGTLDFDARYMLQLEDGTLIYMQNTGYRWASPEAMAKMSRHEDVPFKDYYMRVTPKFEVKSGIYDWLTRYVFVGVAEKIPSGNRIHYFIVR
jgi:hypothetical protein